jgi:hypothetical protein
MRFGTIDLQQSWQDRLERELMVQERDFDLPPLAVQESSAGGKVQFGQWMVDRGIRFDRDGNGR